MNINEVYTGHRNNILMKNFVALKIYGRGEGDLFT